VWPSCLRPLTRRCIGDYAARDHEYDRYISTLLNMAALVTVDRSLMCSG